MESDPMTERVSAKSSSWPSGDLYVCFTVSGFFFSDFSPWIWFHKLLSNIMNDSHLKEEHDGCASLDLTNLSRRISCMSAALPSDIWSLSVCCCVKTEHPSFWHLNATHPWTRTQSNKNFLSSNRRNHHESSVLCILLTWHIISDDQYLHRQWIKAPV